MPFADLSEPPAPHLAQAVDMDLTTDLGRLADTRVIARASAAVLGSSANVDVKRAGRELDVRHVVTGSVKRDGEQLHITVQLARTDTGALLWTERFDYVSAADWVAHRDVSGRIANVLDARVDGAALEQARRPVEQRRRRPLDARRVRPVAPEDPRRAVAGALGVRGRAGRATRLEPCAGRPCGDPCPRGAVPLGGRPQLDARTAERLARKALEIDPQDQRAMMMLSNALNFNGRLEEAMVVTRRQLVANPNDADSNRDLAAVLYFSGRWEETLRQLEVPLKLNPLDRTNVWKIHSIAANSLIALRRYDEAIERARLAIDSPAGGHLHLACRRGAARQPGRGAATCRRSAEAPAQLHDRPPTRARGSTEPAFVAGMDTSSKGCGWPACLMTRWRRAKFGTVLPSRPEA